MFKAVIGIIWIVAGLLFIVRPGFFKHWLRWRSIWTIRRTLFWLALGAGFSLILAVWRLPGFFSKILILFGIIGIMKAYYFLKWKSSEHLIDWFAELPDSVYRYWALAYIAIGVILIFLI